MSHTLFAKPKNTLPQHLPPFYAQSVMRLSFFFTLRQTPPLFLIRSAAISLSLNTRRCCAISLSLNTRNPGGAIAGRRYAPTTPLFRYRSIRVAAALFRYRSIRAAWAGLSPAGDTPSWRGYVLAATGGLRAYAAHCPRAIAPFATSPKNDETRPKTTKPAQRAGFLNINPVRGLRRVAPGNAGG